MRICLAIALTFWCAATAGTLQENRWDSAKVAPHRAREAGRIVDRIMASEGRYRAVSSSTSVPWFVISSLHNMESSGSFRHHLHEGSPLSGRTRWVPKGRPRGGSPPFTWEVSAIDALNYDKMGSKDWTSLTATLDACEGYNGWGYKKYHPGTPTPYLWAGTSVEKPGKYVADNKWSSTARSSQIGVATIWKTMEQRGIIDMRRLKR